MARKTANELFREKFGRDLPNTDPRSPSYDYKAKLAARQEAMKNCGAYLAECERRYRGGSLSI